MRKKSKPAAPLSKEIVDQLDAIADYCDPSDYGSLSPDEKARWDKQISNFNPDYRIPILFPKPYMVRQRIDDLTSKWQRIDDCQLFIPALNDYLDCLRADLVALGLNVIPGDTLKLPTCYEIAKIRDTRKLSDLWRSFIRVMGIFRSAVPEDDPEDRPKLNFLSDEKLRSLPTAAELLWHAAKLEKFAKALPNLHRMIGRMRVDEYIYLDRDHPRRKNKQLDDEGQRTINVIYTAVMQAVPFNTELADALRTASGTLGAFIDNDFKGIFSKENAEKLLWAAEIIREQAVKIDPENMHEKNGGGKQNKPKRTRKPKGKPKITGDEKRHRINVVNSWEEYKTGTEKRPGQSRKQSFCDDYQDHFPGITVAQLDIFLGWHRHLPVKSRK